MGYRSSQTPVEPPPDAVRVRTTNTNPSLLRAAPAGQTVWRPGSQVEKWRLLGHLASGGFTEVFRARHTMTRRMAAIKVLHANLAANSIAARRMVKEAQLMAGIKQKCPNLAEVLDAGVVEGRPFIALELLDGRNGRDLLVEEGPFSPERALYIVTEVARALVVAHDINVVHRDLKPENIFITDDNVVKLLDFGTAKFLEFGPRITQEGRHPGTTPYMSPEQAAGEDVDARSDIYALGMIFDEFLCGKHVFAQGPDQWPSEAELRRRMKDGAIPPLAKRRPDLPRVLASIIDKATRKDRRARYPTAEAMYEDLVAARRRLRAASPILSTPPSSLEEGDPARPSLGLFAHRRRTLEPETIPAVPAALRSQLGAPTLRESEDRQWWRTEDDHLELVRPMSARSRYAKYLLSGFVATLAATLAVVVSFMLQPARRQGPPSPSRASAVQVPAAPVPAEAVPAAPVSAEAVPTEAVPAAPVSAEAVPAEAALANPVSSAEPVLADSARPSQALAPARVAKAVASSASRAAATAGTKPAASAGTKPAASAGTKPAASAVEPHPIPARSATPTISSDLDVPAWVRDNGGAPARARDNGGAPKPAVEKPKILLPFERN